MIHTLPDTDEGNAAALAEAISLLTCKVHGIPHPGRSAEVSETAVMFALVAICTRLLAEMYPEDHGAEAVAAVGAGVALPD